MDTIVISVSNIRRRNNDMNMKNMLKIYQE